MATYEYICLSCETLFEQRRSMTATVDTATACPSCGSERVRRRFSLFATTSSGNAAWGGPSPSVGGEPRSAGGCGCGGSCVCGAH